MNKCCASKFKNISEAKLFFALADGSAGAALQKYYVELITLATNIIGNWFLMRRRAWWSDSKIFFATIFGIMHRVAGRVSESLPQLFLKRFSKMLESGLEPTREKNGRSGDRTHAGSHEPLCLRLWHRGSRPREARTPVTNIQKSSTRLNNLGPLLQRRYSRL